MEDEVGQALISLGFTNLESMLYGALLRDAPLTGYRLAQRVGKAPANVYGALRSLVAKGAVVSSSGTDEVRSFSPIPPAELLTGIQSAYDSRIEAARTLLESAYTPIKDESFYQLVTVPQVFDRLRTMLRDAREIVIFDFFPEIYEMFREDIEATRDRGVLVAGIAYRPEDGQQYMPYNGESSELVQSRWPGLGVILVVDGLQQLVAQVSRNMDKVLNAVYSDSNFLSCVFHSALAADVRLVAFRHDHSDPLKILSLQRSAPPGLRAILGAAGDVPER